MVPVPPTHEANGKADPYEGARPTEQEEHRMMVCRVRTIADMISTGMIESPLRISMTSSARLPLHVSPSAAPAPTTKPARRRWRTERKRGIFRMSDAQQTIELLRFNTCGSVDDGKSTLIGRLLYDSKSIMEDQMEALERSADITGGGQVNLANLTDGLRAEREQGITIDVAYRYVATPKRKFIVADTPGHVEYTRNMVTGASTANLSIVLVDARNGVIEQTRRHSYISALLGIPHIVFAVNKMDLVDWSEERFREIREGIEAFLPKLNLFKDVKFIPISALEGDNVVTFSDRTPWYEGPTLLGHIESVHIASDWNLNGLRFRAMGESPEQSDRSGVTRFPRPVRPDCWWHCESGSGSARTAERPEKSHPGNLDLRRTA